MKLAMFGVLNVLYVKVANVNIYARSDLHPLNVSLE